MLFFVVFVVGASYLIAIGLGYDLSFVGTALIFSGLLSFASYWWSDKIILSISKARPATRSEFFDYYTVTENIVSGQRMPMPKLYVIDDTAMNAFATGRDPQHAVVCATTGLLQRLSRSEIEGVVAHELAHVKNYDIRLMSIVTILVGMVALLSDWALRMTIWGRSGRSRDNEKEGGQAQMILMVAGITLALLSPLIAQIIQLAISRKREFLADASGVGMTRNPNGLLSALKKIDSDREPLEVANKATAHLYISNPLKNTHGAIGWFAKLFRTHPPVGERVAALEKLL
ncbi:MAG: M48 family metallopeptidase [Candidatus Pacebacteria bacterium]|nr:M48 family metallopeptidase [Candidatus Paceibacterota bacterium]PIR60732.1 MAG: zinc metalloprotease HtpX [Candidatus Pacebacteria bacterium CG10_big_fil_rev_8_21_14_0_10_44_54]